MLRAFTHPALRSSFRRTYPSLFISRTNATSTESQLLPEEKAKRIIEKIPENAFVTKTGAITLGTGAAAYILSKEIYVINEESLLAVAFIGFCTVLYKLLKDPVREWTDGRIQHVFNVVRRAREGHHTLVSENVDSVAEASNIVNVTKALFDMSKEMTELEAKLFDLKQRTTFTSEIKSVLDAWVRHEASVRDRQQKQLATQILERLHKQLEDPKVQQEILNQCISEIESIASKRV